VAQVAQAHQTLILEVQSHTQVAAVVVQAMALFNPAQVLRAVVLVDQVQLARMEQTTEVAVAVVAVVLTTAAMVDQE
jgi:hypothetical protein